MKMYLPFGDWSYDGHCQYTTVLIDAPSMEHLLAAQNALKSIYGNHFFENFAEDYDEPTISKEIWQALIDFNYPIKNLKEFETYNDWSNCNSIQDCMEINTYAHLDLDFVIDAFIWLLNSQGANIVRLNESEGIPVINNWTCHGFETVGYGCFLA